MVNELVQPKTYTTPHTTQSRKNNGTLYLLSAIEWTALGSEEKYSWIKASSADIRWEGISLTILVARSPALREVESLCVCVCVGGCV